MAEHPNTAPDTLLLLACDREEKIREAIAQREVSTHGGLPAFVQHQLANDVSAKIRQSLVSRPDLTVSTMMILVNNPSEDEGIIEPIIQHPNVTPEILVGLGEHAKAAIREAVAHHPLTPLPTLLQLARDADGRVQTGVLGNPGATPDVLMILLSNPKLHEQIARSSNANGKVLEKLAYDAAYARFLRIWGLLEKTPLKSKQPVLRWKKWSKGRASSQAFSRLSVLRAVIEHPETTPRAVVFARRLKHLEIDAALQRRRAGAGLQKAKLFWQEEDDE